MTENNNLSEREIETLKLVAQGMSNKQIASSLFISINTVKVHLRNIFEKIKVESRTEATLYAIEHGIIPSPGPEFVPAPVVEPEISPSRKWFRKYWWLGIPLAFIIILGLALILSNSPIFRSPAPTPSFVQGVATVQRWTELAPMSVARASLAVAAHDNAIYAIGGDTAEGVTGLVESYDPQTDSWKILKSKTTPVSSVSAAVIGGEVYVPGGKQAAGSATNVLEVYDPQQDSWQQKAPLPIAVYGYALATFEGRMYLFGGTDGSGALDAVLIYDPQQDRWQPGSPMPTARAYAGAAEAGGKIYVIGGRNGKSLLDLTLIYTPSKDQSKGEPWEKGSSSPEVVNPTKVLSVSDIIYFLGKDGVWQYPTRSNTWNFFGIKEPKLISSDSGVVSTREVIYILGGIRDNNFRSDNFRFQAIFSIILPYINQ